MLIFLQSHFYSLEVLPHILLIEELGFLPSIWINIFSFARYLAVVLISKVFRYKLGHHEKHLNKLYSNCRLVALSVQYEALHNSMSRNIGK